VHRHDGIGGDIWLIEGDTISRWTFDAAQDNSNPIWSPDGRFIAFGSLRNGKWGIYQKPSNGTGDEQLLVQPDAICVPMSWSPDGRYLVYSVLDFKGSSDLWALPLSGDRKPFAIAQTSFSENHAQVSPDGKWVAFNSEETGTNQIYVKPFPSGSGKWQASTSGGIFPRWRRDGHELFYMENSDAGRMMATGVKINGESIQFTPSQALFDSNHINVVHATNYHTFDVSPNGDRFLLARPEDSLLTDSANAPPITVVLNWTALLKSK
jgi:eukaryotic-like serine/threonine-protein kinase